MNRSAVAWLAVVLAAGSPARGQDVRLKYLVRYDARGAGTKEVVGVEKVLDHHALISSAGALALVDLDALVPGGTQAFVDWLPGMPSYATFSRPDGYVYVNLRLGGLAVVHLDAGTLTLTDLGEISEPGVIFERMAVVGDRLYVAAHAYGLRIYDLANPAVPSLVGSLTTGLDDANAVAVLGDVAYIADGAGGLKIVDITDETSPQVIEGEDPESAAGTSLDIAIIGSHVYVAAGGSGVAVYDVGSISSRTLYETPVSAEQLARVGDHLVVADLGGLEVFAIEADGSLTAAARELAMRRVYEATYSTRLWHGVSNWGADRILAASWDSMDVYELVDPALDDQADVTASTQRLRFAPEGGTQIVVLTNDGAGPLEMTGIYSTEPTFSVQPGLAMLQPGESMDLTVTYAGGLPGSAMVMIESNDPDESPLPIQVFGETQYLDPGEEAIPFTLESWTYDHGTQQFEHSPFDLMAQTGKIVYFHVYTTM